MEGIKDMARILIFSPYACRYHLTAYEGTIAKACQIRGATIEYMLCDGMLPECDMHWDSFPDNAPRPFNICQSCMTRAEKKMAEFALPYRWLGEFVSEAERSDAFAWAQNVPLSEIRHASFMEYPMGDLVLSTMASYFRQYPPDMENWRVVNVYRGFLLSAALVAIGLTNYLKSHEVDAALLFNGRQSITRVAFEIFRRHGIRVLTHEFPFYKRGHLMVKPNARCWSLEPFADFWRMWGSVPLTRDSLEKTLQWLRNRRYANGLSWFAFNAPLVGNASIRSTLNLSPEKRLMALFTSSTDETAGDPELEGPFESQNEWVRSVVAWVKERNDVELLIRVHPHLAGNTGLGKAVDEYNFYLALKSALPTNIRIIMPDESLNSYALMIEADVCLSFGSTVGIEMALLGKPVVLGARAFYENGAHILTVRSRESLPQILEKSLESFPVRERQREAFRLAYYNVFRFELPFPLVTMSNVMKAKLNYTGLEALAPGRDDTLDHICGYLVDDRPLFDPPTETELTRPTDDEDAFLAELERSPEPLRDLEYEKWLRLNSIGRSIQGVIQRLPLGTGNIVNYLGKAVYLPLLRRVKRRG